MPTPALSKRERYFLTVAGRETDRPPVWMMRQAGRYMPEYMAVRRNHTFLDLCYKPEVSAEVSLQPLTVLDVDILIIFNDILIPLEQMGLSVDFPDSGPRIADPPRSVNDLDRFRVATFGDPPVARSIRALRAQAGPNIPILGFAGCPFTLVSYAVEGKMSRNAHEIKALVYREPKLVHEMLARATETAVNYLIAQVADGGADGVQIFESQAATLAVPGDYEEFAAAYQRKLVAKFRAACPGVPIQLFAKGSSPILESMASTGVDVVSIDWTTSLVEARRRVTTTLQGNLDPTVLIVPDAVEREVRRMLEGFDHRRGWIANLGHGIIPQASVEGAKRFVRAIQALGS